MINNETLEKKNGFKSMNGECQLMESKENWIDVLIELNKKGEQKVLLEIQDVNSNQD